MRGHPGEALTRALLVLFAWACASCGEGGEPRGAAARRLSLILISLDTLRADHMGLYGYERDTTPHLDRLAAESLVFERAFAPASWTLVSHMTMLTGLYPNQHGILEGSYALARETPLLAERLQRLGYQTVGLYFEGWIHRRHGFDRGFDVFRAHRDAEEAEEHLAEELAKLDRDRPFFLFLHIFDVHCGPLSVEPGPIYDCPPPYDTFFLADAPERLPDVAEGKLWKVPGLLDPRALEGLVALYDGGIRYVDDKLGAWIEGWKREGWLDDSLLLLTADHGEALGQRGNINDHGGGYQEGLRVPLIVRHPRRLRAGERVLDTVHLVDVVPTALEFLGLPLDERLPGRSLFATQQNRAVYALSPPSFEILWTWPEKLVRLPSAGTFLQVDLEKDPDELVGAPLEPKIFEERRSAFLAALGSFVHAPPTPVEEEDLEAVELLKELGY